ncbi:TIGR03943 family protein [Streptomyces sp. WAC06614]|uniref:TIGR03943 family putative permease subunit n=1 Tax=Streptomyces sp. WAC06614 TaxID=2487416 RepID=UPI00163D24C6|nr:TIGR03943 family protein [Streptomyces sp. WAC06614]
MTGRPPARAARPGLLSGLGPPVLLALTGTGLLHTTVRSDVYLRYVKEGLRPYLIASGVLLLALGLAGLGAEVVRRVRQPLDDHAEAEPDDHAEGPVDHGHGGASHVAWLLAAPALTLMFIAPPALGSYTASRDRAAAGVERAAYEELPDAAVTPLALEDFVGRSVHAPNTLRGRTVRLLGFASAGRTPGTWYLNRLKLSCCAADARTLRVEMRGVQAPAGDTWVEVTGVWRGDVVAADRPVPTLEVATVNPVDPPRNPYHDAAPTDG